MADSFVYMISTGQEPEQSEEGMNIDTEEGAEGRQQHTVMVSVGYTTPQIKSLSQAKTKL
jgi:hypothetical protein